VGATGPTGVAGPTGASGIQGIQGIQGEAGLGINFKGQVATVEDLPLPADQGDAYIVQADDSFWVYDETDGWVNGGSIQGPQGIEGPMGATGPAGATGATGEAGATGATGVQGETGPIGLTGDEGATGATGVTGTPGADGATGPTGATGATGPAGTAGADGATGATGIAGPTGASGPAGAGTPGNNDVGVIYLKANSTATTIGAANGRAVVAGTMQTGELYNFAQDSGTNSLKYSGIGGLFHIVATFNFASTSQNVCGFYIGHNTDDATALDPDADRISESEIYINASTTANQPVGGAIQTVLELETDDRVFFIVQNRTDANSITVEFLKFTVTPLTAEKGDEGATGVTGATGPTGETGPVGATGATGFTGETGPVGATGPTGASGVAGADGATGATGPQGDAGTTGTDGATGPTGASGPTGPLGATGATGPAGATGVGTVTSVTATNPLASTGGNTPDISIQDGTTAQKGAVQLEDSTSSTSTTKAATPNSVKSAYDLADAALPKAGGALTGDVTLGNQSDLRFGEATANGSNYVAFQAPASVTADVTWTLPAADGSTGQTLTTNGTGTLSWASAGGGFDPGTVMLFQQTTAPTGWTKLTTHDNKALRIVSGTVGSGGSTAFTSVFASRTPSGSVSGSNSSGAVGATTLTTSQIPSHQHRTVGGSDVNLSAPTASVPARFNGTTGSATANAHTNAAGGGGSHNHSFTNPTWSGSFTGSAMDFAVQYVDVIMASKD
jgi:hypothetical protein